MSVRKRTWGDPKAPQTAWIADYKDEQGKRRQQSFKLKRDADEFLQKASVMIREGTFISNNNTETVAQAGAAWLEKSKSKGLELSTIAQYRQHLEFHIAPFIGSRRLTSLTSRTVREFEDTLINAGRSGALTVKVLTSLSSIIADAKERGKVQQNVVLDVKRDRSGAASRLARRNKPNLIVGKDVPTPDEIRRFIAVSDQKWRPFFMTAIFTGLRASELRGLSWRDVDLKKQQLHVRQRADRYGVIGVPKSAACLRTLPLSSELARELARWKLVCPRPAAPTMTEDGLGLVFPNGAGNVESLANLINRGLVPLMLKAEIVAARDGRAKYTGLHTLRHFYASFCINRKEDGGLGVNPKLLQKRMGHATIGITLDTYSHLFPVEHDPEELEHAERVLLGTQRM
ncbi:site-specific integrase [Devosia sp. MC532]|nr:site-specific integrase [Devosia sp. MC532]MBJ7578431.1 site-specific integrase [Devosia sp. MC532]